MIFFSTAMALEPVLEAWGQNARLKQETLCIAVLNFVLNANLIPFAGIEGAAIATSAVMFIHFLRLFRFMPPALSKTGIVWPPAAAALYLTYIILARGDMGIVVSLLLGGLLWLVGFFNSPAGPALTVMRANEPSWEQ